jgi:ribosome small subunit-dependent GTPase A
MLLRRCPVRLPTLSGVQSARSRSTAALLRVPGTVVESHGRHGTVLMHESGLRLRCRLDKHLAKLDARAREEHFVIGDHVAIEVPTGGLPEPVPAVGQAAAAAVAVVVERHPRTRTLRRHVSAHSQRAVATAVDQLVLVTAVQPPPNPGLLDRFIVLAEAEGIEVVVVLNKVDLGGDALRKAQTMLAPYPAAGYDLHEISVSRGDGLPELRGRLASAPGRLSILAGHSGVGKSSLMNELVPDARLPTDELSRSRRGFRGRHMTTRRTCHLIPTTPEWSGCSQQRQMAEPATAASWPAESAMVVDTAGVRSFGLVGVPQFTLLDGFQEFHRLSSGCRCVSCNPVPLHNLLSRILCFALDVGADPHSVV